MMLAGRTALSVEIITNRSVPIVSAARNALSVPNTLTRAPSTGWSSRTGTCLWAAAWKTTSGRWRRNTSNSASGSVTSARTCSQGPGTVAAVSCRCVSSRSSSRSWPGLNLATWRAISEPIDPPAPVMRTRRPARECSTASRSVETEVRPRRSSICGSRAWRTATCRGRAATMSRTEGSTFMGTPAASAADRARSTSFGSGSGMASSTCWIMKRGAVAGMSSTAPMTGTPMSERPCSWTLSSKTATGTRPAPGLRIISRTAAAPASRLPITPTRSPVRRAPRCQANSREWKRSAPMAMVRKANPMMTTGTGTRSSLASCHSGRNTKRTSTTVKALRMTCRASSMPAWRQIRS